MCLASTELAYYLLITANWRGKPEISTGHHKALTDCESAVALGKTSR